MIFKSKKKKVFSFAGHSFYTINPDAMPVSRVNALSSELKVLDWGMNKDAHLKSCNMQADYIDKMNSELVLGNPDKAYEWSQKAKELIIAKRNILELEHTIQPYVQLASYVILIDDEKINKIDSDLIGLKRELASKHQSIKDFFLSTIIPIVSVLNGSKEYGSIWESLHLEAVNWTETTFYKLIESESNTAT